MYKNKCPLIIYETGSRGFRIINYTELNRPRGREYRLNFVTTIRK